MYQRFTRPDWYIARCGRLDCAVTEHRIGGAPAFMRGLRALFISDVHVTARATRADLEGFAARVGALAPDILLLGGDYSDAAEGAERLFATLSARGLPLGGYGVIGNNDAEAWEGRLRDLRRLMARAGFRLLVNQCALIKRNGGSLWIGGVDEHLYGRPDLGRPFPDAPRGDAYRVLLSHYPARPRSMPELLLCGHTHGGQFNLLGVTPFTIGFERFRRPRMPYLAVSGLHGRDGARVLVSKGIGASRLQLRVGVRPEIDLLVFDESSDAGR